MELHGNIVNPIQKTIVEAVITIENKLIVKQTIVNSSPNQQLPYIIPGFIDSHIHIESSMLTPSQFARMAVVHGTVGTVSDPHEIANVCGMQGIEFMIEDGKKVPFHFNFGAPSCVPATSFETAGATITVANIDTLLQRNDIKYLSEMMNFPGVLNGDVEVMAKIALAKKYAKPIDGHAPGLRGEDAKRYSRTLAANEENSVSENTKVNNADSKANVMEGSLHLYPSLGGGGAVVIATDHECFTYDEALEKLQLGMKILIREGSAAKNFEALIPLLNHWEDSILFCSDDKHPDSLEQDHINELCARAVAKGIDVFKVLKAACINPILHYKLNIGQLQIGDAADCIVVKDLTHFEVLQTYIQGQLVAANGQSNIITEKSTTINNFNCTKKEVIDFMYTANDFDDEIAVIEALDGQLITNKIIVQKELLEKNDVLESNVEKDILKIVVVNRYTNAPVAKAFIKNVGLQIGAIASSVAHDSHNIVAIGVDDYSICEAVNKIIEHKGGLSYSDSLSLGRGVGPACRTGRGRGALPLPIAGLMTNEDGYVVSKQYTAMDLYVKETMGSTLQSPYMTLSFMALLVIPHLKLSDKGLFDGDRFTFVN